MERLTAQQVQEIARRAADGDVDAFERLFRTFHAPLCELVDLYVHSQEVAEEIVQDLFLAIWMSRGRLGETRSPSGYLFTAARNRAIRHLRHGSVVWRGKQRLAAHPATVPIAEDVRLVTAETNAAVRKAIDCLPPRMRLAVVLQTYHEMSQAEIAVAMDISLKGVEKLLSTAKAKLRVQLGSNTGVAPT